MFTRFTGLLIVGLVSFSVKAAYISDIISPSVYNSDTDILNSNLGIDSSFTIEDFEDNILADGLTISIPGHSSFSNLCGSNPAAEKWDGDCVLHNVDETPMDGRDVSFLLDEGTTMFGIGISHLEQSTYLMINDTINLGLVYNDPDWVFGGPNVQNGYLWITATDGDLISSVAFNGPDLSDSIFFDHAAWVTTDVPEPSSIVLFGIGLLGLLGFRKKA